MAKKSTKKDHGVIKIIKIINEYAGIISLVFAILVSVVGVASKILSIPAKIDELNKDVNTVKENIEIMKFPVGRMWFDETGERLQFQTALERAGDVIVLDGAQGNLLTALVDVDNYVVSDVPFSNKNSDKIYTTDFNGKEYKAEDITNNLILIPYYQTDDTLIVFYGYINEKGHWDGKCVLNVYENGSLELVSENDYNDGVCEEKNLCYIEGNECSLIVSDTEETDIYDCYRYTVSKEIENDIIVNQISADNVRYVDDFFKYVKGNKIHHYRGGIDNKKYSDESGKAYFVSYYEDGTVKTLYCGNFVNGKFSDNTGNAWEISRDRENNTSYMYYRGAFKDNKASLIQEERVEFENPVKKDTIWFLVNGRAFEKELVWDYDYVEK